MLFRCKFYQLLSESLLNMHVPLQGVEEVEVEEEEEEEMEEEMEEVE